MEKNVSYVCNACKDTSSTDESETKTYCRIFSKDFLYVCAKCLMPFDMGFVEKNIQSSRYSVSTWCENIDFDKTFGTENRIDERKPIDSNGFIYKCDNSLRTFQTQNDLRFHEKLRSEKIPFRYEVCEKYCRSKAVYQKHLLKHTSTRPYKCTFCTAAYKCKQYLQDHMNLHKDPNPFRCEVCNKSCTSKGALEEHIHSHSNERSYKCTERPSQYKTKANLSRHKNVHKEQNPYRCKVCKKNCDSTPHLKDHMTIHSESRPYTCQICSYSYKTKRILCVHKKKIHQQGNL